jgi:Na+-driven multidrug efflux pump
MMVAISTPDNIFADAATYLRIYIAGFTFLFLYNVTTGIFTSLGDSKTPLYFLIASSLSNIAMDWLFVAKFHWDVAGVAWATFLCQGVACILALVTLMHRLKSVHCEGKPALFSLSMLKKVGVYAIPSVLQQSFISIGNIFVQRLVNSYGSSVIAGYSAAIKLNTFAITSFTTLGNGVSNFTAQNLGAGKWERIKDGYHAGVKIVLMIAVPFFVLYFFCGTAMVQLFMSGESTDALQTGVTFLRVVSPFYFVICVKLATDGILRGSGAMGYFMIATFSDLILRVILAYILSVPYQSLGIWLSWPIGWVIAAILSVAFYKKGVWKKQMM